MPGSAPVLMILKRKMAQEIAQSQEVIRFSGIKAE